MCVQTDTVLIKYYRISDSGYSVSSAFLPSPSSAIMSVRSEANVIDL